mmetsp:Transcript_41806/g.45381  ORF Transcript_41806/g.45381 Transcript_41806/m.45381 type:complete len:140 (+) Transcript_41806:58-477(+)
MGKFFEILSSKDNNNNNNDNDDKRFVEAFCICVEPKACSRVVKELSSTLPLEGGLSHLKRVRKRILSSTSSSSSISCHQTTTITTNNTFAVDGFDLPFSYKKKTLKTQLYWISLAQQMKENRLNEVTHIMMDSHILFYN